MDNTKNNFVPLLALEAICFIWPLGQKCYSSLLFGHFAAHEVYPCIFTLFFYDGQLPAHRSRKSGRGGNQSSFTLRLAPRLWHLEVDLKCHPKKSLERRMIQKYCFFSYRFTLRFGVSWCNYLTAFTVYRNSNISGYTKVRTGSVLRSSIKSWGTYYVLFVYLFVTVDVVCREKQY